MKLEELWRERFPLGRGRGFITLKSVNGEEIEIRLVGANYSIRITDPNTGKVAFLWDNQLGNVWVEGNSVWYRHRTTVVENGRSVEKSTPVEIEIEKGE